MDPVSMTFLGLLGAVVAGAWISFSGRPRPTSPRHRALPPPTDWRTDWTTMPKPPRVSRRGFGTHLASNLPRHPRRGVDPHAVTRRWSAFAYSGMWSPWARR